MYLVVQLLDESFLVFLIPQALKHTRGTLYEAIEDCLVLALHIFDVLRVVYYILRKFVNLRRYFQKINVCKFISFVHCFSFYLNR